MFFKRSHRDKQFHSLTPEQGHRLRELVRDNVSAEGWHVNFEAKAPTMVITRNGIAHHGDLTELAEKFAQCEDQNQERTLVWIYVQRISAALDDTLHFKVLPSSFLEQEAEKSGSTYNNSSYQVTPALTAVLCDGPKDNPLVVSDQRLKDRYGTQPAFDKARNKTIEMLDALPLTVDRLTSGLEELPIIRLFCESPTLPSVLVIPLALDPYVSNSDNEVDWDLGVLVAVPNYSSVLCVPVVEDARIRTAGETISTLARELFDSSERKLSPNVYRAFPDGHIEFACGYRTDTDTGERKFSVSPVLEQFSSDDDAHAYPEFDSSGIPIPPPLPDGDQADTAFARLTKNQAQHMLLDLTGFFDAHGWQARFSHSEPVMWAVRGERVQQFDLLNVAEEFSRLGSRRDEHSFIRVIVQTFLTSLESDEPDKSRTLAEDRANYSSALHYRVLTSTEFADSRHADQSFGNTSKEIAPGVWRVLGDGPISRGELVTDVTLKAEYNNFNFHNQAVSNTLDHLSELEMVVEHLANSIVRLVGDEGMLPSVLTAPIALHEYLSDPQWSQGILIAVPDRGKALCAEVHHGEDLRFTIQAMVKIAQAEFEEARTPFSPRVYQVFDDGRIQEAAWFEQSGLRINKQLQDLIDWQAPRN